MSTVDRIDRLALDVDTRLVSLWALLTERGLGEVELKIAAEFMRSAYAKGYDDALREPHRGQLYRENGYVVPKRERR